MSIYGTPTKKAPIPEISKKQLLLFAAIIVVLAVFFALATIVSEFLKPKPITASFTLNPLDLSKEQSTVLKVRVFNPAQETVENALLSLQPVDGESLIVFPSAQSIPAIGSNEFREYSFSVRPNPSTKIASGNYKLKIILKIGSTEFTEETVLTIKAIQ